MAEDTTQNGTQPMTGGDSTASSAQVGGTSKDSSQAQGGAQNGSSPTQSRKRGPLSEELKKFEIPQFVKDKYPEFIPLIIETESMTDEERQYWFSILPVMTPEQTEKLREILMNEKEQLKKLDEEYAKELNNINDKQVSQWHEKEAKEKWAKIRTAEQKAESEEKSEEEELLKKLGSV